MAAKVVAERLDEIAEVVQSAAVEAEERARRLRLLEEQARAAARLALRTP